MTRTQKRIVNLARYRRELTAERAERIRKHRERSAIERELRMVTTKLIRLELRVA